MTEHKHHGHKPDKDDTEAPIVAFDDPDNLPPPGDDDSGGGGTKNPPPPSTNG